MNAGYSDVVVGEKYLLCVKQEETVDIYKITDLSAFVRSQTIFDTGGKRLALGEDQALFCCANYYDGIAAYDLQTGRQVWMNKSVKQIQHVYFTTGGILVRTEKRKLHLLSFDNGEALRTVDNATKIYNTDIANLFIAIVRKNFYFISVNGHEFVSEPIKWLKTNDSFHRMSRQGDRIFVLRAYKSFESWFLNGKLLWTSDIKKGFLINSIFYSRDGKELFCWAAYNANTHMDYYIIRVDMATGKVIDKYLMKSSIFDICIYRQTESRSFVTTVR